MVGAATAVLSRRRAAGLAAVLAALAHSPAVHAQAYPNKPVKMIVPFAPGGASDFVARIISPKLGELLGQTVSVPPPAGTTSTGK